MYRKFWKLEIQENRNLTQYWIHSRSHSVPSSFASFPLLQGIHAVCPIAWLMLFSQRVQVDAPSDSEKVPTAQRVQLSPPRNESFKF